MDTLDKIKAAVASIEEQLPLSLEYESDRDTWPERWRQLKIAIDAAGPQPDNAPICANESGECILKGFDECSRGCDYYR